MTNDMEPRALGAALSTPAFVPRGHGVAVHFAHRHVERWAPEAEAGRVRSMRSLGFVDRLVAPWMETAQRSASLRLFSQYSRTGMSEREPGAVSWLFPRPWFQDELDWMAAARQASSQAASRQAAPTLLTTRGTYVPASPSIASSITTPPVAMPSALYEYVAPSLSMAASQPAPGDAYSPLISLAAVQAADLMSRTVAPLAGSHRGSASATAMTPGLRSVLTSILARSATPRAVEAPPSRVAMSAPELVTPPAPRASDLPGDAGDETAASAARVAEQYAEQRMQIALLQRIAQQSAQREIAARAEAVARTQTSRAADVQRQADATQETAAERARIEERVAQRLAERTGARRIHEQARAEAAAHVRTPIEPAGGSAAAAAPSTVEHRAPAEVTAAIAGLPPELAAILGSTVTQRPERALQAISELNETLRTVELLARSSATGATFEATRGPRLMMPAGLGGLVNAVDRAPMIADRPAMLGSSRLLAPLPPGQASQPSGLFGSRRPALDARVPALAWLSDAPRPQAIAPSSALGATATTSPAALSHVAWADRWLARFAGAGSQSLDVMAAAAAAAPATRMAALANAAPGVVFVAPDFLRGDLGAEQAARFDTQGRPIAPFAAAVAPGPVPGAGVPGMRLINPAGPAVSEPLRRFDDAAETPDDVFAAISAAASRGRVAAARPAAGTSGTPSGTATGASAAPAAPPAQGAVRPTLADLVAHAAPAAPGAGLSAQLASSPFAPALRHVLPLPSAASFDVRSLFGAGLGATYLAGLLGPASRELEIGAKMVPAFDAAYVSPEAPGVRDELAARGELAASVPASGERGTSLPLTTLRTALLSWELTTASELGAQPGTSQLVPASFASVSSIGSAYRDDASPSSTTARAMIEAMRMPMLGEMAGDQPSQASGWAAPGMIAERAHTWSVVQERSSSDLAFDFVAPELVLAARVYGLGPAEAAQAARLAIAGPSQLGAMASTVDRTFVEAMTIDAERRQRVAAGMSSAPGVSGASSAGSAPDQPSEARAALITAFPTSSGAIAAAVAPTMLAPRSSAASGTSFGVDRRSPRGAFLWPSAAVAALGMTAAGSDGQPSIPVAALELLAAQVVAELGTFTALSEAGAATRGIAGEAEGPSGVLGAGLAGAQPERGAAPGRAGTLVGASPAALADRRDASDAALGAEPGEADVLGAAAALVPASRRARFDALYVALGQSSAGKSWSPAARAARALALAGRGEDNGVTARERAATAWDVLPVVYPSNGGAAAVTSATAGYASAVAAMSTYATPSGLGSLGAASIRSGAPTPAARAGAPRSRRDGGGRELVSPDSPGSAYVSGATGEPVWVQVSPGLTGLSARAGEALGSYVTPVASPSAPQDRPAPEYVRPSRSGGRYGGGEVEIPPWFEAAARKMLAEHSGDAGGISLAELTLVTAAPASHIAASTRSAPSAASHTPSTGPATNQSNVPHIDVEKLANEIYRSILVLMDVARARNGDPYL